MRICSWPHNIIPNIYEKIKSSVDFLWIFEVDFNADLRKVKITWYNNSAFEFIVIALKDNFDFFL